MHRRPISSSIGQPAQQSDRGFELCPLLGHEFLPNDSNQPVGAHRPGGHHARPRLVGQRPDRLAAVAGIGSTGYDARALQRGDRRAHRLGADALRVGEFGHGGGPLLQRRHRHHLRRGEIADVRLLAHPPLQLPKQPPEIAGKGDESRFFRIFSGFAHAGRVTDRKKTAKVPSYFAVIRLSGTFPAPVVLELE